MLQGAQLPFFLIEECDLTICTCPASHISAEPRQSLQKLFTRKTGNSISEAYCDLYLIP